MMWLNRLRDQAVAWAALAVCSVLASPLVILGWQSLHWLRFGVWEPWPVWRAIQHVGWRFPETEWAGVQRILWWLLDLPLALAIPLMGVALLWLAGTIGQVTGRLD